jgi:hypothetical protein
MVVVVLGCWLLLLPRRGCAAPLQHQSGVEDN